MIKYRPVRKRFAEDLAAQRQLLVAASRSGQACLTPALSSSTVH
jgi:hypothetical protein